ncbi:MAG: AAA family ATPase, partial [Pseudomonadales bacterium]|nr:AAA family ATPase [Pseudomonadales bacterium]
MKPVEGFDIVKVLFVNERTIVARARRGSDQQDVILKQLGQELPDSGQLSRFSFSYDVLRKLDHENIIRPLEWIKHDIHPTMVLEDIHGIELGEYLKRFPNEQLPLAKFSDIAVQLADAVSVIHHAQVIHKDLHPGNIIVNPETLRVQIIDFGMASLLSREQPSLSAPEQIEGLLPYISPEQTGRMNRALDYRTDFYTLGVVFYKLLAGCLPFSEVDALGYVHAHIAKQQSPLLSLRDDIPPVFAEIVNRLLKKTAEERYQSALGLSKDLQRCRRALAQSQQVPDFPLGLDDVSDRFQVPQRLYGRQSENKLLMSQFFAAASGNPKMLAIGGYSGVGKSALVYEVHKPIAAHHGIFLSGKFDQFQRSIPYSAIQQAFHGWLQHVLTLPDLKLKELKIMINQSVGMNARVLIDFMPEFSLLLGELPPVARLGADETKNRFHTVFQHFIKVITAQRPLVIFIDDVQWADRGTLDLLPVLLSEEGCRLLVVVAYRSNEVDSAHPAMETLQNIARSRFSVGELSRVVLEPLSIEDIQEMLQDALFQPRNEVLTLAELVHNKTAGNPFFVGEFLKALYTERLLNFDLQRQRWCWNIEAIEAKGITDNVVDLMLTKMALLPSGTREMIQLAACVGSRFDLDILALVSGKPLIEVTRLIWPALKQGVLLQDGGDWFLGMVHQSSNASSFFGEQGQLMSESSPLSPHCRFLHDRMLQAAYESMAEEDQKETHLQIGRLLLAHLHQQREEIRFFDVVEQLNLGRELISDMRERDTLIELNLTAAQRAKESSVWQAAADYSAVGIGLLPDNCWETHYEITRDLYHTKAESEYLAGRPEYSETFYQQLFLGIKEILLKADIYASRVTQAIGRGQWLQGKQYALMALETLGLSVPETTAALRFALETELECLNQSLLQLKDVNDFQQLPEVDEKRWLIALRVYPELAVIGWLTNDELFSDYCTIKSVNITFEHGRSEMAANILVCYAKYLREQRQFQTAIKIAHWTKVLLESGEPCANKANSFNLLALVVWNLCGKLSECVELHKQGAKIGLENGEIARSVINRINMTHCQLTQGYNLNSLRLSVQKNVELLRKYVIFQPPARFIETFLNKVTLQDTRDIDVFADDQVENIDMIKKSLHSGILTLFKMLLAFWESKEQQVVVYVAQDPNYRQALEGTAPKTETMQLYCLSVLRHKSHVDPDGEALFEYCFSYLKELAFLNPQNFEHGFLLISAEKARTEQQSMEVISGYYRDAIVAATNHGFIHFQALANEYFAEFWVSQGLSMAAIPYLQSALQLYQEWGCQVKVKYLEQCYRELLQQRGDSFIGQRNYSRSEVTSAPKNTGIDIAKCMRCVQEISKQLRFEQLVDATLQSIVELTESSLGAIVSIDSEELYLTSILANDHDVPQFTEKALLKNLNFLPSSLIEDSAHRGIMINVGDVMGEHQYSEDPYLLRLQPKSVLCMPIFLRSELSGIIYLENQVLLNAYTPDQISIIKLLLAQAIITAENGMLIQEVKDFNASLEDKVEERTHELARAVKDLSRANEDLNSFSYSVSHDLRAPLRHLNGFAHVLNEDYSSTLDPAAQGLINRIIKNSDKMANLIDGLLELSRMQRHEIKLSVVDLSLMVQEFCDEMKERFPMQPVSLQIADNCYVRADQRMLSSVIENLLNNAWKYSSKKELTEIKFGYILAKDFGYPSGVGLVPRELNPDAVIYFISDNGAG